MNLYSYQAGLLRTKQLHFLALCLILSTLLLSAFGFPTTAWAQEQQPLQGAQSYTVHITSNGFTPAELTLVPGDSVTWVNDMPANVTLNSQSIFRLFLPTIQREGGNVNQQETTNEADTAQALNNPQLLLAELPLNRQLLPGESFTQIFDSQGIFGFKIEGVDSSLCTVNVVGEAQPTATPTNTPVENLATATPTATADGSSTATATPTVTSEGTTPATATSTATAQTLPTDQATPTPTATNDPAATATATATLSPVATESATATPTSTTDAGNATATPTTGATATATATSNGINPTATPSATFTAMPTATNTATPVVNATPTGTSAATATATSVAAATNTATSTATTANPPTATNTTLPANTATATRTPTRTPTVTRTATATPSPTATATATSIYSATPTDTPQATASPTPLKSPTAEPTATNTPALNSLTGVIVVTNDISSTTTWTSSNVYVIYGEIHVNQSVTLNIQQGVVVRFGTNTVTNKAGKLIVDGKLNAQGAQNNPIVFTSINDDRFGPDLQTNGTSSWVQHGDWAGISFPSTSIGSVINHVLIIGAGKAPEEASVTVNGSSLDLLNSEVQMSGSAALSWQNNSIGQIKNNLLNTNMTHGIILRSKAHPQIADNIISHNRSYAIYQEGTCFPTLSGNTVYGNGINGVGVFGGVTTGQWSLNANLPYVVADTVLVSPTYKLTLPAGLVVKFQTGKKMVVQGALAASGLITSPVVFTSLKNDLVGGDTQQDGAASKPAAGDWESLAFADSTLDAQTSLDYVEISYGGSNANSGALVITSSLPSLNHLTLTYSKGRGLYVYNAQPIVQNSAFSGNVIGILNGTSASVTVNNSSFYMNSQYGISNTNPINNVTAVQNWWGDGNGPRHTSNGAAIGDAVSDRVSFSPWISSTPSNLPLPLLIFAPPVTSTQVSGVLATNTTWTLAQSPYLVSADVTINAGVRLTIQPGVVVKFATAKSLIVNGILDAVGTSGQHIIFTSAKDDTAGGDSNGDKNASQPQAGDWAHILFSDSSSDASTQLQYAEVRYAGLKNASVQDGIYIDAASPTLQNNLIFKTVGYGIHVRTQGAPILRNNLILDNRDGGIFLEKSSTPTLENNQMWGNGGYAIYMDGTCAPTLTGNVAYYNGTNGVRTGGKITTNISYRPDLPYIIEQPLSVEAGGKLTLQPNVVIKFASPGSTLTINGGFVATGTTNSHVYFTSLNDDSVGGDANNNGGALWPLTADWGYLYFTDLSDDAVNLIQNAIVRYGDDNMLKIQSAAPRILDNQIYRSQGFAFQIYDQATPLIQGNDVWENLSGAIKLQNAAMPTLESNHLHSNGSYVIDMEADTQPALVTNQINDNGANAIRVTGNLTGSLTWDLNSPTLPYAPGNVTIQPGASLTLQAGTIVKFIPGTWWTLNGQLLVEGDVLEPVIFTSLLDDNIGGDSNADGSKTTPQRSDWLYINYKSGSSGSYLGHAVVRYGSMPTLKLESAQVDMDHVLFEHNRQAVWGSAASGNLSNLTFTDNSEYAIYSTSSSFNVHNSTFVDNQRGIYIRTSPANSPTMSNNIFEDNTEYSYNTDANSFYLLGGSNIFTSTVGNTVQMDNGSLGMTNTTFYAGRVYQLGTVTTLTTATVTIQPGAILKFPLSSSNLTVQGQLMAGGLNGAPVYFTSLKDDSVGGDSNFDGSATTPVAGDWKELNIDNNAKATLKNVILRYGGRTKALLYAPKNATVTLDSCVVMLSKTAGIVMNSNTGSSASDFFTSTLTLTSTTVISNVKFGIQMDAYQRTLAPVGSGLNKFSVYSSTITQNSDSGIYIDLASSAVVSNTDIFGNANYGIEALATASVTANGNWWGHVSGPAPTGSGDKITAYVIAATWRGSPVH